MNKIRQKTVFQIMRALHRDIGFFLIGLTVIYCVSGVALTYRHSDIFKIEVKIERSLPPELSLKQVSRAIRKRVKLTKEEGAILYFNDGHYNRETGEVVYRTKRFPVLLKKFNRLHMTSGRQIRHYFTVLYGAGLFFLAVSSFWMYKPGTKKFKRGMMFTGAGIIASVALLLI